MNLCFFLQFQTCVSNDITKMYALKKNFRSKSLKCDTIYAARVLHPQFLRFSLSPTLQCSSSCDSIINATQGSMYFALPLSLFFLVRSQTSQRSQVSRSANQWLSHGGAYPLPQTSLVTGVNCAHCIREWVAIDC